MKNPETEEIDKEINKLLDLLNSTKYPDFNPPRGISVKDFKDDLMKQIRSLNSKRRDNIITKNKNKITPREFNKELKMGIKDESGEHKGDALKSTDIALDHLSKNPKYYTKLKKIEESISFNNYYNLAEALDRETLGLMEPIKIEGIDTELVALIDSGNAAYNVLHGVDIEDRGSEVEFITANNIRVVRPKVDEITIHVGAGHDEHRPVVEFTVEIGNKVYPDVKFSIGDRTENQHPVLVGVDFLKQINVLIDVNKE